MDCMSRPHMELKWSDSRGGSKRYFELAEEEVEMRWTSTDEDNSMAIDKQIEFPHQHNRRVGEAENVNYSVNMNYEDMTIRLPDWHLTIKAWSNKILKSHLQCGCFGVAGGVVEEEKTICETSTLLLYELRVSVGGWVNATPSATAPQLLFLPLLMQKYGEDLKDLKLKWYYSVVCSRRGNGNRITFVWQGLQNVF